jgi:all-trans-8'-apo-beta-carotenal 15,15'-oxygenase
MPESHEFCGQPTFTPRTKEGSSNEDGGEDDGYLLTLLYNGRTKSSELVVLNALNPSAGPIARVALSAITGGIPHGNYGCFAPADRSDAGWSSGEIERRAKLADKMELKGSRWNEVKSDFSGLGLRLDDWEEYFGDII